MASPITQRVKTAFNQGREVDQVVTDKGKLGYPKLEDKVTAINEATPLVEANEGQVVKASKERCGIEVSNDDPRCVAFNAMSKDEVQASEQKQGLREGYVSQADADTQNAANAEANNENKEYGTVVPVELDNKYQENQTRAGAMNQVRRNRSLQRNIKRENNKARRGLNKQARKGTLSEQQKKDLKYYNDNRYTSGSGGNAKRDANGNIIGSSLEDAMGDMNRGIGFTGKVSGGDANTEANRQRMINEGRVDEFGNDITFKKQTAGEGVAKGKKASKLPETGYKQKGYSGFQQNPKSYKKQVGGELLDKAGNKIGDVSNTGSFSKVSSDIVPYNGPKVKSLGTGAPKVSGGTKLLNKVNKGLNKLPDKGKIGLLKKIGLGVTGAGLGYLGYKVATASTPPPPDKTNGDVDVKPKKGKSYDQAYQDRDRKTYGHMNKSNYIKEAKRQNDVFGKTGKWDYKNAPKDPGPVSSIKPAKVAPVSSGTKPTANVNLDKISQPERKPTISKKQGKALNKLSKLEGRKQTSRRDIRIAKQKDKAAGLSRKQVRQNKQMRKGNFTTTRTSSGSVTGGQPAINNFINKNENATIKQREDELKASTGFKQKGFSGFQK
jgi:hypothetical protein